MRFEKKSLSALPCCYAVNIITIDGRDRYVFAADDFGPCYCFDAETGEREVVWESPGGTMSIVPLPGRNGNFLASQRFMPGFMARDAEIVLARRIQGKWQTEHWLKLPYVHRFDILKRNNTYYFLGCILCSTDKELADWNAPGYLAASALDADFSPPKRLACIADGFHRNHGYWRFQRDGYDRALVSCDEGVFEVIPPENAESDWQTIRILDKPASDAVYCDIDNDGTDELAVIEPFHGTDFVVYRRESKGFTEIYRYPEKMEFLHAIWGGELCGERVFIGGYRRLEKNLFVLKWRDGGIRAQVIERGSGPSNVFVVNKQSSAHISNDRLIVANREAGGADLFEAYESEK